MIKATKIYTKKREAFRVFFCRRSLLHFIFDFSLIFHFISISCLLSSQLICFIYSFIYIHVYVCVLCRLHFCFLISVCASCSSANGAVIAFHCSILLLFFFSLSNSTDNKMFHISHSQCVLHVSFHMCARPSFYFFRACIQFI